MSRDFVCDGEVDCPNGEDEKFCRGIQGSPTDPYVQQKIKNKYVAYK